MATLPRATTVVSDTAGAVAAGLDTVCILAPVATAADITPRQYGSAQAVYEQHGYCEGVEYCALHASRTRKPFVFVGLPIGTPGAISREDTSGNTNTCDTTLSTGSDGVLAEHDGQLTVIDGGVVGTDPIVLGLSMSGGREIKRVRLGTAFSYTIPYFNVIVTFGAGSLTAGETIHTWHGNAPVCDTNDLAAARAALAAGEGAFRSILLIGDLASDTEADDFLTELDAYETENERFIYGRASVYDRLPQAALSNSTWRKSALGTLTFNDDVGGDTATRSAGSWITDGFAVGDWVTFSGTASNNVSGKITTLDATIMGFGAVALLADEGPVTGAACVGQASIVFDATAETITRSRGSWFTDGFRDADSVTITGTATATNDGTFVIGTLTATVMTLGAGDVDANETAGAADQTIVTGQTKAAWMAEIDAEFASVDDAFRIDLSAGRGRIASPFSGWRLRRPASWAASIREYQHDVHIATWRKDDGPTGFDLFDADGVLAEWDDRVDGEAACAARFTAFRTWANGPRGAFIAQSLTRADDNSLLSQTHNVAVVNVACTVTQLNTENVIGRSLVLNDDGTATTDSLNTIATEVNAALELALLQNRGEGQRASKAVWTPSADDILNVPEALLTGVVELNLNGTIHSVSTQVSVISGGQ
jgi:hypothetical protein